MTFIPETIKDIIYTYINELKTEKIISELKSKIKICRRCDEEKVVIGNINDGTCKCDEFLCSDCLLYDDQCIYCLDYEEAFISEWNEYDWEDMHGIVSWAEIY